MNIEGNWTNSGTFTHSNNTVILDGTNQSILGSTTFNNLTKNVTTQRTLTFDSSGTQTIVGTLDLKGEKDNLLLLRSSSSPNLWGLDVQGSEDLEFLNVRDSNSVTTVSCVIGCVNAMNNFKWSFTSGTPPTPLQIKKGKIKEGKVVIQQEIQSLFVDFKAPIISTNFKFKPIANLVRPSTSSFYLPKNNLTTNNISNFSGMEDFMIQAQSESFTKITDTLA